MEAASRTKRLALAPIPEKLTCVGLQHLGPCNPTWLAPRWQLARLDGSSLNLPHPMAPPTASCKPWCLV